MDSVRNPKFKGAKKIISMSRGPRIDVVIAWGLLFCVFIFLICCFCCWFKCWICERCKRRNVTEKPVSEDSSHLSAALNPPLDPRKELRRQDAVCLPDVPQGEPTEGSTEIKIPDVLETASETTNHNHRTLPLPPRKPETILNQGINSQALATSSEEVLQLEGQRVVVLPRDKTETDQANIKDQTNARAPKNDGSEELIDLSNLNMPSVAMNDAICPMQMAVPKLKVVTRKENFMKTFLVRPHKYPKPSIVANGQQENQPIGKTELVTQTTKL